MSPAIEAALRSLGAVVLFAILGWLANSANLAPIIGVAGSALVAAIVAAVDKSYSPNGTLGFGTIGSSQ